MSRSVLVVNSGSSSLKYAVVEPDSWWMVADGIVERIGDGPVADHAEALQTAFEQLAESGRPLATLGLVAVGHRVVHGGPDLYRPTVVDDSAVALDRMYVSAGRRGLQVALAPADLIRLTSAVTAAIRT